MSTPTKVRALAPDLTGMSFGHSVFATAHAPRLPFAFDKSQLLARASLRCTASSEGRWTMIDTCKVNDALEGASSDEIVRWTADTFGPGCVAAVSLQSPVLPHLVVTHAPRIPLLFLDTGYHFPETLRYRETLEARLGVSVSATTPPQPLDDQWRSDPSGCCEARKVLPLARALRDRQAFLTGVRRTDHPGRGDADVVAWDERFGVYRVQPLVGMTDADVEVYMTSHDLPSHPLRELGYASIGCWPCTSPVVDGEDPRAGRWPGTDKVECGINHSYGS